MDAEYQTIKIELPEVAETWGTKEFVETFLEAVSECSMQLPLWAVCSSGSPSGEEDAECWDLKFETTDKDKITGSFAYSFFEDTNQGCRDKTHSEKLSGRLDFDFDHRTGTLGIPFPRRRADYDPEEY